ncbi:DUF4179 domain-containing protein [Metabacillus iocasae]|uniref:DUF4179 domain-containing protein n=1 Tax=Priestia iocasae TaxID=2291674 RepID=A0ABS2QUW7_9BACI|nr:DUF4179 domain-containing protein [Metabacillus iocasae]MBM7702993.1 hypothetical protein [Metabacillus iocasae]
MKHLYERFNDIKVKEQDYKELPVTDLEKAGLKKSLKQNLPKSRKNKWKKQLVAAAVLIGLSTATIGLSFPTYASNLPIVGNIFTLLDEKLYGNYKEYSQELNLTENDKGIAITINDALFDGETVSVTYSVQTEQPLGKDIMLLGPSMSLKGFSANSGSNQLTQIAENKYVGLVRVTGMNGEKQDVANVKWNIEGMRDMNEEREINGTWNFAFSIPATDSTLHEVHKSSEKDGVKVNIQSISQTPVSTILHYNQEVSYDVIKHWSMADVQLQVEDDLGNSYAGEGNGGVGDDSYNINWSHTVEKLHPDATNLVITPVVTLRNNDADNHGGVTIDGKEVKTPKAPLSKNRVQEPKSIILDKIVIELNP